MGNYYANGISAKYEERARELRREALQAIGCRVANSVSRLWGTAQSPRSKRLTPRVALVKDQ